jgi:hypothetical protein
MFSNRLLLVSSFILLTGLIFILPNEGVAGLMPMGIGCCKTVDQPPLTPGGECIGCEGESCFTSADFCASQGGFFDVDLGCTTTPDGAVCAEILVGLLGCCVTEEDACIDEISLDSCESNIAGMDVWVSGTSCENVPLCNEPPPPPPANVPTISHVGLIAAAIVLGAIGFFMLIRRKKTV